MEYPLTQLERWAEKGLFVTLASIRGGRWTCNISNSDMYGGSALGEANDTSRVRAISGVGATPKEAIESLLKVAQP